MKLMDTGNGNTKIKKTADKDEKVRMASLSMMPDQKLCPSSLNAECFDLCLKHSGLALVYKSVNDARRKKTEFFHGDNKAFLDQLIRELGNFSKLCKKQNVKGVVRLNVLSDVPWEKHGVPQQFPELFFYDYTKLAKRLDKTPKNYELMFSYSAAPKYKSQVRMAVKTNAPISVVFRNGFPKTFLNRPVIDGDQSDLDNVRAGRVIVGLKVKGSAIKDHDNKFIVDSNMIARA